MKDYTDAKFEVIKPKRQMRWHFDWRLFLIIAFCSAMAALLPLIRP